MNYYLQRIKPFLEQALIFESGKKEIAQYNQVVDFAIIDNDGSSKRFQIKTSQGSVSFYDQEELIQQPLEDLFVVIVRHDDFDRLFKRQETFIDLWNENAVRCLPTMKKDYLIGWVARIFELAKQLD